MDKEKKKKMKNRLDIWKITWYYSLATAEDSRC